MDDSAVIPSVPPGFVPLTSFTLQRIQDDDMASAHPDPMQIQMDMDCSIISTEKFKKSLRHRPWVNYKQFDDSSEEEEPDFEPFAQGVPSIHCLPKGVIRGCNHCSNCQKVTARWRSEDACRPVVDEAPVFYPTEEEFKDTLKYIASIRSRAESYGICRIVPPPSWSPPCPLKEKDVWEHSEFVTRTQHVHKLQNRGPVKELSRNHSIMKTKRRKLVKMGSESTNCNESIVGKGELGSYKNAERFGFEPGPEFTLNSFQKYADDFKEQYFQIENMDADLSSRQWEPSVENIEGEYWRIIERPTEEIEVLYGADLETGVFGSGFPKKSSAPLDSDLYNHYVNSGWNLNNLPRLPGSVLSFESGDISGVLVPWLYIGMCFSSFCWHVEDHHLYSLNYLHWGAPKLWYGVPAREALKLEGAMKKHLAELFEEQPDLLHNLVTQFSPSILKSEGVPVYRCVQHSGEFILTFPRAYHSGFNCGFNCAEAVNVAPIDWLPHGQNAVELYREQGRKISISHDKLLLGAARETVRAQWNIRFLKMDTSTNSIWKDISGTDDILAMALKARIEMDRARRDFLCASSQSRKMEASFDSNCERECAICHYDLHLSAAGCPCSPEKFACLIHAKQICSCPWQKRFFLFRYEISEMNVLLDAVGGKLSAVHRWALSDLGLSLSSYVKKDKGLESKNSSEGPKRENEPVSQDSSTSGGRSCSLFQETKSCSLEVSKEPEKIVVNAAGSSCSIADHPMHQQSNRMAKSVSNVPCAEGSSLCGNIDNQGSHSKKGQKSSDFSLSSVSGHRPSQEGNLVSKVDKGLSSNSRDAIVLSEDKCQSVHELLPHKPKVEAFAENPEAFARLKNSDDKVTSCNSHQDRVLIPPETNACLLSEGDIDLQFVMGKTGSLPNLVPTKVGDQENEMTCEVDLSILPDRQLSRSFPQVTSSKMKSSDIPVEKSAAEFSLKEGNDCSIRKNENNIQHLLLCGTGTSNDEGKDRKIEPDSDYNLVDRGKSNTESSSHSLRPQKGPRMAKVVRRFNSNVEPLEYGVVLSGKLWSTSQAIFPKGYRSRVRYFSITDPTQMCYYVSEILDAGLLGPLFMVAFEPCPSEVFIHVSATKCWDMVRERVNNGIRKQHSLGKTNLPSLQPPGSLDGLEMYGLSSPKIIQAIEGIDRNHVCTEYWKSQSTSSRHVIEESRHCLLPGTDAALRGLFKKGNPEELHVLHSTLRSDAPETKQEVIQLLTKEIESRSIT